MTAAARGAALARVIDRLTCPVCRGSLRLDGGRSLLCERRHRFDVARQGYVTLLAGTRVFAGDDAAMVAARETFLARGHYDTISTALAEAVAQALGDSRDERLDEGAVVGARGLRDEGPDGRRHGRAVREAPAGEVPWSPLVVDLAGGTGHHLARVLAAVPGADGLVLEASVPALRRAARAHERLAAIGADVTRPLPLRDGTADGVLSVFGPRPVPEIQRVLAPEGRLIVATPTPRHLAELVDALGPAGMVRVDPDKEARLAASLSGFTVEDERLVEHEVALTHQDVRDEVAMGPSAHHVDPAELEGCLAGLPESVGVTVSVTVRAYRR